MLYNITLEPSNETYFQEGVTAVVSFTKIWFKDGNMQNMVSSEIIQANSSFVSVEIIALNGSQITALEGYVVIFGNKILESKQLFLSLNNCRRNRILFGNLLCKHHQFLISYNQLCEYCGKLFQDNWESN